MPPVVPTASSTGFNFGGFPCQPFSRMRRRKASIHISAEDHEEFEGAKKQIKHLRESQPTAAVLENSTGASDPGEFEGEVSSGAKYLYEQIKDLYFMAVVRLDLRVWVALSRPRLWIFLVRRDVGSQDIVDKAVEIVRGMRPPMQSNVLLWCIRALSI